MTPRKMFHLNGNEKTLESEKSSSSLKQKAIRWNKEWKPNEMNWNGNAADKGVIKLFYWLREAIMTLSFAAFRL